MQYANAVWNRRIGAGLGVLSSFAAVGVLLAPLLRLIGVGADENNAVVWVVAVLIAAVVVRLSMARCTRLAVSRSRGRVVVTNPVRTHVVDLDDIVEVDGAFVLFAGTCVRVTVHPPGARRRRVTMFALPAREPRAAALLDPAQEPPASSVSTADADD